MNSKQVPATHYVYRVFYLALVAAGLVAALPGHARATLFDPIVEAKITAVSSSMTVSQSNPVGPVTVTHSDPTTSAAAWTNYGINRATSHIAGSNYGPNPVSHARMNAISTWTDQFTINVPSLSYGAPINFLFSFGLDGSLAAHEDNNTAAKATVEFRTFSGMTNVNSALTHNVNFTASIQPTPSSTAGGDASATIHETALSGNYGVYNGMPFDLSARLHAWSFIYFVGPPASVVADSLFYNTAELLGWSVEVNGSPVSSFTITSGSGHNYNSPAPVPEPSTILLLGAGLAGLGLWGRKRMARS